MGTFDGVKAFEVLCNGPRRDNTNLKAKVFRALGDLWKADDDEAISHVLMSAMEVCLESDWESTATALVAAVAANPKKAHLLLQEVDRFTKGSPNDPSDMHRLPFMQKSAGFAFGIMLGLFRAALWMVEQDYEETFAEPFSETVVAILLSHKLFWPNPNIQLTADERHRYEAQLSEAIKSWIHTKYLRFQTDYDGLDILKKFAERSPQPLPDSALPRLIFRELLSAQFYALSDFKQMRAMLSLQQLNQTVFFQRRKESTFCGPPYVNLHLCYATRESIDLTPAQADGNPTEEGGHFQLSWSDFCRYYEPVNE